MTEAMPFLQKAILLSYDPRPFGRGIFFGSALCERSNWGEGRQYTGKRRGA